MVGNTRMAGNTGPEDNLTLGGNTATGGMGPRDNTTSGAKAATGADASPTDNTTLGGNAATGADVGPTDNTTSGANAATGTGAGLGANAPSGGNTPTPPPRLALAGWILYLVSWITPGSEPGWFGARAFLASVEYGLRLLFHPQSIAAAVLGVCLLAGWLANFPILIRRRLSVRARVAWSIAPWLPVIGGLLLMDAPLMVRERLIWQLYFYPWALGIACIHAAMIVRHHRKQPAGGRK